MSADTLLLLLITAGTIAAVRWAVRLKYKRVQSKLGKGLVEVMLTLLILYSPQWDQALFARRPVAEQQDQGGPPSSRRKWLFLRRPGPRPRRFRRRT